MTRNQAVCEARKAGADVLVMVDSDQRPDKYLPETYPDEAPYWDTTAEPFFETAFDFLYQHWNEWPVCIGAPYCGPPPIENVLVFHWTNAQSEHPNADLVLTQYTRPEGAQMQGIHPCAALPTGVIMFDIRLFELTGANPPDFQKRTAEHLRLYQGQELNDSTIHEISDWLAQQKYRAEQSWFYYEWKTPEQAEKASTEDVTATRDISLAALSRYGQNPVHCAWSSWAGHWKPKCVGKPIMLTANDVSDTLARAITEGRDSRRRMVDIQGGKV